MGGLGLQLPVVELLGGIVQCRVVGIAEVLVVWLEAMNTGLTVKLLGRVCGCIRPSSCLVAGCILDKRVRLCRVRTVKLLGGVTINCGVHLGKTKGRRSG